MSSDKEQKARSHHGARTTFHVSKSSATQNASEAGPTTKLVRIQTIPAPTSDRLATFAEAKRSLISTDPVPVNQGVGSGTSLAIGGRFRCGAGLFPIRNTG